MGAYNSAMLSYLQKIELQLSLCPNLDFCIHFYNIANVLSDKLNELQTTVLEMEFRHSVFFVDIIRHKILYGNKEVNR